jgi:hypothetical protein
LDRLLGLLLLAVYVVGITSLAAFVTYLVVKIFPTERTPKEPESSPPTSDEGTPQAGRLFRRAKRGTT